MFPLNSSNIALMLQISQKSNFLLQPLELEIQKDEEEKKKETKKEEKKTSPWYCRIDNKNPV